jgi:hypothetical protein
MTPRVSAGIKFATLLRPDMPVTAEAYRIPGARIFVLLPALLFAACLPELDFPPDFDNNPPATASQPDAGDPPAEDPPPVIAADQSPALLGTAVTYDPVSAAVSVSFNFNMEVTSTTVEGWDLTPADGGKRLTLGPRADLSPGTPVTVSLAAGNSLAPDKTTEVEATFMPVDAVFERPAEAVEYRLVYYDNNAAAGIVSGDAGIVSGETTAWYYIADPGLRGIFNAVYSPNAPENGPDTVSDPGKTALPYTTELSKKVIGLFSILVAPESSGDRIEIRGADLPVHESPYKLVVIDIGVPGEDNAALPGFCIPQGELGTSGENYSHIRFRVSRGAYLYIEADNSAYIANGPPYSEAPWTADPCPPGYLAGASVEVMGGGKLRAGAYRGFPLGQDTVIIARLGSWFARGPESSFCPGKAGYDEERDKWYRGWLLGPREADPGILWDGGDQNGSYVEFRAGRAAFDANITIRRSLVLARDVWFISGPSVTIAAAGGDLELNGKKGLFAGGSGYRFYGTASLSGGQNPAKPAAKIIIEKDSSLSASFLTDGTPAPEFIGGEKTVINRGRTSDSEQVFFEEKSRGGYLNWQ